MCRVGRFEFSSANERDRLRNPRIRVEGRLREADWKEATRYVAERLREDPQIVLFPNCTNEEAFLASRIAVHLKGEVISISDTIEDPAILGGVGSTITFEEIPRQDLVMVYDTNIVYDYSVAGVMVRRAKALGNEVVIVGDKPHRISGATVLRHSGIGLLEGLIATAAREQLLRGEAYDMIDFTEQELLNRLSMLSQEQITDMAQEPYEELARLAKALSFGKGAIVFGPISGEEARRIALFRQITDTEIVMLRGGPNGQALSDLGIEVVRSEDFEGRARKSILILGVPPTGFRRPMGVRFLAVQAFDEPFTEADAVLPKSTRFENRGTFLTTDRRLCLLNRAIDGRKENWEIISEIMREMRISPAYDTLGEVTEALMPELKYLRDDRAL